MPADLNPEFGSDHLGSAADRAALAAILDAQGRHGEALTKLEEAIAVVEALLGPEHYEVAVLLATTAAVAERAGDDERAAALRERERRIKRRVLGTRPFQFPDAWD